MVLLELQRWERDHSPRPIFFILESEEAYDRWSEENEVFLGTYDIARLWGTPPYIPLRAIKISTRMVDPLDFRAEGNPWDARPPTWVFRGVRDALRAYYGWPVPWPPEEEIVPLASPPKRKS